MAEYRTGVPRREGITGVRGMSTSAGTGYETDNLGFVESVSLRNSSDKSRNEKFSAQKFDPNSGMTVRKWGSPDGQEYEQVKKTCRSLKDIEDDANWIMSMGSVPGSNDRDLPDRECCAWLRIKAPSSVKSGSTSGISAGAKRGCVYYWSIEGCNPSYWGCGSLAAAGTGGSGAGLHQTSLGMVFIAPTIPDAKTINCGRTVDTKIKVAILTSDGQKQAAAAVGTAGWSGFGMGPGDELYDLFGPENVCDDTANITTVADDCNSSCVGISIAMVSTHLRTGETVTISVTGYSQGNDALRWELFGGGILSSSSGPTTNYRASSTNYNCEENAVVNLYCNGSLVDSVSITVNDYTLPQRATMVGSDHSAEEFCGVYYSACMHNCAYCWADALDCDGNLYYHDAENISCGGGAYTGHKPGEPCPPPGDLDLCTSTPCLGCSSVQECWNVGGWPRDLRSDSMKADGCCPPVPM